MATARKTTRAAGAPPTKPPRKASSDELPLVPFADAAAWDAWLAENHGTPGVRLQLAKKGSGVRSVTYAEAVEVALAWGWIDGKAKRIDDVWYEQRFTPRTSDSLWSKINREKALAMIEAGTMRPPGLAAIERAKQNGRWETAYESWGTATVPDDLQAAFDANPEAAAFFATLKGQNRYAVLHRIATAKRPETRRQRIAKFVEMLAKHEVLHP